MANYEATRYDFDGANLIGIQGINTGLIIPWSESSLPSGFLECDGTAVSRSTYAALFAVVGTNYGVGDGSTTFNVPDLKDRVCQHKSPTKVFASTGGANTVSATGNISGTIGNTTLSTPLIASHSHPMTAGSNRDGAQGTGSAPGNSGSTGGGSAHDHPASGTFTGDATSVLQPYMALVYIIKT